MAPPSFPPAVAELMAIPHPVALGRGSPNRIAGDRLRRLDVGSLFAPAMATNADMAIACLAGLWLRFDFLDESHGLSQGVATAEGSFWHGIMHRREGDFGNAKYWFRRVGTHPVLEALATAVPGLSAVGTRRWDPFAFVDLVEAYVDHQVGDGETLQTAQQTEWRILFDHCYRLAISS